jgi:preprotein translocase subunit SecA
MLDGIKEEAVGFLFNLEVQVVEEPAAPEPTEGVPLALPEAEPHVEIRAKGLGASRTPRALQYSAPVIDGAAGTGGGVVVERDDAPALGLGVNGSGPSGNGARGGGRGGARGSGGSGTARRSGPPLPTSSARQAAPGQVTGGGGPSRNAPCPCGSGKKYKRCHGAPGGPA